MFLSRLLSAVESLFKIAISEAAVRQLIFALLYHPYKTVNKQLLPKKKR